MTEMVRERQRRGGGEAGGLKKIERKKGRGGRAKGEKGSEREEGQRREVRER